MNRLSNFTIHDVWEISFCRGASCCLSGLSDLVGELHSILNEFEGIEKTIVGQENRFAR